jgi:hypothetical protein
MPKGNFTPAIDCTNEQRQPITLHAVKSSQIAAIGYSPETNTLAVQFTRGFGNVYEYPDVTPAQHQAFVTSDSIGAHFGQHIQMLPSKKFKPEPLPLPDVAATDEPTEDTRPTAAELEAAGQTRLIA